MTAPAGDGRTAGGEPRPVADVDEKVAAALKVFHRGRWAALAAAGALLVAAVITLAILYAGDHAQLRAEQRIAARQQAQLTRLAQVAARQEAELRASCRWWQPLTPLPVTIPPGAKQPTRLSVTLLAGARQAYRGQHCPGPIPPIDPTLAHWAAVYRIPVR